MNLPANCMKNDDFLKREIDDLDSYPLNEDIQSIRLDDLASELCLVKYDLSFAKKETDRYREKYETILELYYKLQFSLLA
jgi:hypothetical protein